ncbi:hypothetical protein KFE25_002555 [Diacronema lutheri]|uniref:OTU domain-containing protein n=1 Tax=Diacronema lutheri TaxID=2081491 RepID=A0A8J5X9E0_DIALT|nr:hypothetical protein KFE25_002555 [Diacronema lutheri]
MSATPLTPLVRQLTTHSEASQVAESLGFVRREIPPDGNCLFRACAEICLGSQGRCVEMREAVRGYLAAHRERFEPFVEDNFDEYLSKVGRDGHWGSDLELQAIAELHDTQFTVYANNRLNSVTIAPSRRGARRAAALWFSHGNHYDALYTPHEFARRGFSASANAELDEFRQKRREDEAKSLQLGRELSEEGKADGTHTSADWMIRGSDHREATPNLMDADVGATLGGLSLQLSTAAVGESSGQSIQQQQQQQPSTDGRRLPPLPPTPPGALSEDQRRRPTISNLLAAGFSEAELAQQFNPPPAYSTATLPPELLRRHTVMSMLEAGINEDEIRRQMQP